MIDEVHTSVAKHLIEVGELEKELAESRRELNSLEEQQKLPGPSQEFINILEGFSQLDEFTGVKPKLDSSMFLKKTTSGKKNSRRVDESKERKLTSERYSSSSASDRELDDENLDDLFMIENSLKWQRNIEPGGKRQYSVSNSVQWQCLGY